MLYIAKKQQKQEYFFTTEFNEEGTKKLQELNNIYVETTEEQTKENGETENVTKSKKKCLGNTK